MSCSTPTRPLECSAKRLLKRVQMCTERSFERTPVRHRDTKRKTVQTLSNTFSSGISLLSENDLTIVGNSTVIDQTLLSLDKTLTATNEKTLLDDTVVTTPWEIIRSMNGNHSDFSVLSMDNSELSQATVISKRSTKVSNRPQSLLSRLLKPSTPKPLANGVKFINRCVRDIDRLSDTFGQEWITLPNFV